MCDSAKGSCFLAPFSAFLTIPYTPRFCALRDGVSLSLLVSLVLLPTVMGLSFTSRPLLALPFTFAESHLPVLVGY